MNVSPWRGSGAGTGRDESGSTGSSSSASRGASAMAVASEAGSDPGAESGGASASGGASTTAMAAVGRSSLTSPVSSSPATAASSTSSRSATAVMLSSPPAALAASTSACTATSRFSCSRRLSVTGLVHEPAEAVRAEQDHVARARGRRPHVDVDLPVGAERARDDRALRMLGGLLGRQRPGTHPLRDQGVVVREPREHAAAPEVGARVADVRERDGPRPDERRGDGRAHARGARIGGRALGDPAVGEPHGRGQPFLVAALLDELGEGLHRDAATPPRPRARRPCRRRRANSGGSAK